MKITSITFFIGCLAIAGIPGFSGFFSKDEILAGAFAYDKVIYSLTLFAALLTAYYMFRLYIVTFTGKFRGTHEQEHHLHESPWAMTLPLIVLAILSVIGGYVGVPESLGGHHALGHFLSPVIKLPAHLLDHNTEYILMALSTGLILVSIFFAWAKFKNYKVEGEATGFGKVLQNKWYVDEIYTAVITNPLKAISAFFNNIIEKKGIDGMVNGAGKLVNYGSRQFRWLQSGQVGIYVLLMVIGILCLFVVQLFYNN